MKVQTTGKITVSDEKGDFRQRLLSVGELEEPYARVTSSVGLTVNLGNYESVRVTVGVELPCSLDKVHEAMDAAKEYVKAEMKTETAGMRSKAAELSKQGW